MAFSSKAIALFILEVLLLISVNCYADENCETLPTEIHVTKDNINGYYGKLLGNALMHTTCTHTEEYDEMGSLMRSCSGEVSVNKCEGICNSQVQPSVVTPTGFLKECYCCKENYLRERLVTLTHCYDADGMRFQDEDRAIMEVRLREPAECKCYKCGDYSR